MSKNPGADPIPSLVSTRLRWTAVWAWLLLPVMAPAAGPVYWDWPEGESFAEIKLEGAALDGDGHLVAGLAAQGIGPQGSEVYWTLASDGQGGFFTGAGHDGVIYHTDAKGENHQFAQVGASEVLSLLFSPGGGLFAGTGPEGKLFHLDTSGQVKLLGTVEGGYIWSLAQGAKQGEVWLAAGAPAALYRYDRTEGLTRIAAFPATNALDITRAPDGRLYLATQGPGLVYRLDPDHIEASELLFETPQDEARQLVFGPEGDLFVFALNPREKDESSGAGPGSTGQAVPPSPLMLLLGGNGEPTIPRSALWRIRADGLVHPVWSGDEDLMITAWSPRYGWLAGGPLDKELGRSQLLRLTPPAGSHPVAGWSGGDILDILVLGKEQGQDRILVSQGHPHLVVAMGEDVRGARVALSPTLDAKRPARWGRLRWTAAGDAGDLEWSVRGGNRSVPDESWSSWTRSWSDPDHELELAPCRFLQWRVEFPSAAEKDPARVTAVSLSAWLENSVPRIERFEMELLQGIESGGLVSHSENLTQVFRSGLKVEFDRQMTGREAVPARGAAASRAVRVFTWTGEDSDADRLVYRLEYRPEGNGSWRPVGQESQEMLGSWDTSEVPDGSYEMRLTASDKLDNPGSEALASQRVFGPVIVDNTPPQISGLKVRRTPAGLGVEFKAEDQGSVLAAARIQLPDGRIWRLDPVDRICDSRCEKFHREIVWPQADMAPGVEPWRIRVEAQDLNGNVAVAEAEAEGEAR